ncbi:hypothetical protein F0562_035736 [Nyssa sinensis]|uniref:Uncharacterized protein n=1 Tax=Nyssa sinensis TaxID=561372 RepID=A0A5J5AGW3_9ASTE|nr:hypothetical protein F0562_035736 [Nyssa sinensis]
MKEKSCCHLHGANVSDSSYFTIWEFNKVGHGGCYCGEEGGAAGYKSPNLSPSFPGPQSFEHNEKSRQQRQQSVTASSPPLSLSQSIILIKKNGHV